MPILATKLYIPPPRANSVQRPRLTERLNAGLQRKLTLVSASAGFGKTTLVSEWVVGCARLQPKVPVAWLSLDEGDNDRARFLSALVGALQTIAEPFAPSFGAGLLGALQAPMAPPTEAVMTTLLNEITILPNDFVLVLDDYHIVDSTPVDEALAFLLEHMPPQMHLLISTRQDPNLPLARLRARDQLTELRAADLRFTTAEAAEFLNRVMGLALSPQDIAALETRTEGWIAGLHLASLALQGNPGGSGHQDTTTFIKSFTGSHHFVLDYLVEEVLKQQPQPVQTFLLRTSLLARLCGPLCDAVLGSPSGTGQETIEYIERANLFIVPMDNERRWYRYHHLFGDLLRQRLRQHLEHSTARTDNALTIDQLHLRASIWYEANGLPLEAFEHAVAARDTERAARLAEDREIPLHLLGGVTNILNWLASLPTAELDARPSLWVRYASLMLVAGQTMGVDEKLAAGEAALQTAAPDAETRNLIGQIATARATLALTRYQPDAMVTQANRALEYLDPENLSSRATAYWALGFANFFLGDRIASVNAYTEAIALSETSGDTFTWILATIGLGNVQETLNLLHTAAQTLRSVLDVAGDQPLQIISEAQIGLARFLYEWNDLDGAEIYGRQSLQLTRQYDSVIDRFIIAEVFLARVKLARGDVAGSAAMLAQAAQTARQRNFVFRIPEVAAAQVLVLVQQGKYSAAEGLAQTHALPISQARVALAQGDTAAVAVLEPLRAQMEARGWADEQLKLMVLQSVALYAHGDKQKAVQVLREALELAEPQGMIRLFVDEGAPMAALLREAAKQGVDSDYVRRLRAAFRQTKRKTPAAPTLPEPLSERELNVLGLLKTELSGPEIARELNVSLNTLRTHTKHIYSKLGVNSRRTAVVRAQELDLI